MPMKKLASMSHILVNFFRYSLDLTTCNYVSLTLTVDVSMYIQSSYCQVSNSSFITAQNGLNFPDTLTDFWVFEKLENSL